MRLSLKVSISEERKDLKSGAKEMSEAAVMPRETPMRDQIIRVEVSICEVWWVMERSRMIWISVTKIERT